MARKNTLQYQLLTAQSLATSFISPVTFVRNGDNLSYQINISTTDSVGTFAFQISDDYRAYEPTGQVEVPGNWISLTLGGGVPFANGVDDLINVSLNQLGAGAIRVTYTTTTPGTGSCSIFLTSKQIGG